MSGYVRVVPEVALGKTFDYIVPEEFRGQIQLGQRLRVPWGRQTKLAYAVEFPKTPEVQKCKEVLEVIGEKPLIPPVLCRLARWMADYYVCDFNTALKGVLPSAVRSAEDGHKRQLWVAVPGHLNEANVLETLGKAKAQKKAWLHAKQKGGGWLSELIVSAGVSPAVWRALADRGYVLFHKEKMEREPFTGDVQQTEAFFLNDEQQQAWKLILEEAQKLEPKPFLLEGVTGSGKTEVYLQVLGSILEQGKNALILVPEISLTPQTIDHFRSRFEGKKIRVAVLHSQLSQGERHDQWQQIRSGAARIIIGARSAVFAPVENLGVIIVDEEHESSYKQEETPHYHGRDIAVMRGKLENVPVVLGSATPSLESTWNARQNRYRHFKLSQRVDGRELPVVHVVDLRREPKPKKGGLLILSQTLQEAVEKRLARGEQSILFLNRRGFATNVQCPHCGHSEECPQCSVALTYHRTSSKLKCHLCGFESGIPKKCPECEFEGYRYTGFGTQKIEDIVSGAFPQARWQRMDSDSMKGKNAYEKTLNAFRDGRIDLLVGTQMIAKGLHFPNVTCVGVIAADAALNLPDFRAAERVFQQLVQVAGRAGRGQVAGEVFVQSYTPFHPAIQFARHHDVEGFLEQELEFRREYQYPPFTRSVLILFRGKSEEKVRYCIELATKKIKPHLPAGTMMDEPCPAPIAKIKNDYRYHLFLRTKKVMEISPVLKREIVDTTWPDDIRATVNVDPVGML